jgi:hypothetical protein
MSIFTSRIVYALRTQAGVHGAVAGIARRTRYRVGYGSTPDLLVLLDGGDGAVEGADLEDAGIVPALAQCRVGEMVR